LTKTRRNWIDAVKAISMMIVIMNHTGLVLPGVNFWGGMFYVPAFFLLAGYTYEKKECSYKAFVLSKAKRLLIPYFVANGILVGIFLLKDLLAGAFELQKELFVLLGVFYARNQICRPSDVIIFHADETYPLMTVLNSPTWFLPALFLTIILSDILIRLFEDIRKKVLLVIMVFTLVGVVYHYCCPVLLPWSIDIMPFLMILFLTGYEIKKMDLGRRVLELPMSKKVFIYLWGISLMLICGLVNKSYNLSISEMGKSITLTLISSIISTGIVMYVCYWLEKLVPVLVSLLGKFGRHTLTLLCYHFFVYEMLVLVWNGIVGAGNAGAEIGLITKIILIVVTICICMFMDFVMGKVKAIRKNK